MVFRYLTNLPVKIYIKGGSTASGGHQKTGCGRCEPNLEGREAERRRNEEGKDPGIGRRA